VRKVRERCEEGVRKVRERCEEGVRKVGECVRKCDC
jgi:hypothetical protein